MAVFNEIDEGGLNGILTRRLGMPGGSPAPSLAPEIMPQLVLENDRPEWGWPKGEMLVSGNFYQSAVALQLSFVEFINPATSNTIATIRNVTNIGATSFAITRAAFSTAAGVTVLYGGVADLRYTFRSHSILVRTGSAAAVSNQGIFYGMTSTAPPFTGSIILPPGSLVRCVGIAANTTIDFNLTWYERQAQAGELV